METSGLFTDAEIISTYTRKEAIADGDQVELTGDDAQLAREAGWKHPVFLTASITSIIETAVAAEKFCNDYTGVLWDILFMSALKAKQCQPGENLIAFPVIITGTGQKDDTYLMYAQVGARDIDEPEPAITIMLPEDN